LDSACIELVEELADWNLVRCGGSEELLPFWLLLLGLREVVEGSLISSRQRRSFLLGYLVLSVVDEAPVEFGLFRFIETAVGCVA
jgi:hypothetical protein